MELLCDSNIASVRERTVPQQSKLWGVIRWLTVSLIFVSVSVGFSQATPPSIEEGYGTWYQWPASQGGNDHWYGLIQWGMAGTEAERLAKNWGGHLVRFSGAGERDFLRKIVQIKFNNLPYWTALVAGPGQLFNWSDGTAFNSEVVQFDNFTNSRPAQRFFLTPFGTLQAGDDKSIAASLFELTDLPSKIPAAIYKVGVLSLEDSNFFEPDVATASQSRPVNVRSPGVATFKVSTFGPGPLNFQWKVGGVPVANATNSTFDFEVTTLSAGAVSVAVNNVNGGEESIPIPIVVVPFITTGTHTYWKQWPVSQGGNDHWYGIHYFSNVGYAQASELAKRMGAQLIALETKDELNQFVRYYQSASPYFWLGLVRGPGDAFQWLGGESLSYSKWAVGQPIVSDSAATAVIMSDLYFDVSWSLVRSDFTATTTMERTNSPVDISPLVLNEIAPFRLYIGATNRLQFGIIGSPPLAYQWQHNSQPLKGQTNLIFDFSPTNLLQSGDYTLVVSNPFGAATSGPVKVDVYTATPLRLNISRLDSTRVRLTFDHPEDAESVIVEFSLDMVVWWGVTETSSFPGHKEVVDTIKNDDSYPSVYYRLRRRP